MNTRTKLSLLVLIVSTTAMSGLTCPSNCEEGDANPAVDRIDFSLLSTSSPTTGTVRIEGVVENKGSGTFDSSPGQQSVQLYQGTTLLAQQDFEDLAPGATVTVSHDMAWNTATEFPPTFRVIIAYDPDIFIDGNDNNDDCANSDNLLERSGGDINALFP
ncbi:MAG: hypothetical protein ACE5E1_10970 [Phycisphaerae bacterium]